MMPARSYGLAVCGVLRCGKAMATEAVMGEVGLMYLRNRRDMLRMGLCRDIEDRPQDMGTKSL